MFQVSEKLLKSNDIDLETSQNKRISSLVAQSRNIKYITLSQENI